MAININTLVEVASDGGFWCFPTDELDATYSFAGWGATAADAIDDAQVALGELRELYAEKGEIIPEYTFTVKYDIASFFDYFSFLNITKVAELAGINPSLMRRYAAGKAKAGQKQYDKIRAAVRQIADNLAHTVI